MDSLGYTREGYIGHHIGEFHADPPVTSDILQRLTNNEKLHGFEALLKCKDGSIKHKLISSSVLWQDDKFVHTRCFTVDVTERKLAEKRYGGQKRWPRQTASPRASRTKSTTR